MAIRLKELDTGVTVYQATEEPQPKSNIYCEIPYCSADSRRFVYARQNPASAPNNTEYVTCEFGAWKTDVVGRGLGGPAMSHSGILYYRRVTGSGEQELVRLNLGNGGESILFTFPKGFQPKGLGTISPDERYYAYGVALSYDPQRFGTELVDLRDGAREIIHTDPYTCNPHTQFEPSQGKQLMVQHNRGCRFLPDGTRVLLVGPEGATEFLLDIPGGKVTRLQLGPPFTPPSTGHEAWIGSTKEILVSVGATARVGQEKGNLYVIKAGAPPRIVSKGYRFVHVNTSVCGRYFCCDDSLSKGVVIGSIANGNNAFVCHTETSFGREQPTHPHPYLSPDLKWAVFNSDRTGVTQIHAASIPPEMIAGLKNKE